MNCKNCNQEFTIAFEDKAFYERLNISEPSHCPQCRLQRRLAVRNERNIYQRKCGLCDKQFISAYSPDKDLIIYCPECWWSDKWDPYKSGREYDFNKPFFEQFAALRKETPLIGLTAVANENSDFSNRSWYCRNCYLAFDCNTCDNCYYIKTCYYDKDLVDVAHTNDSELCYELMNCDHCFNTKYSIYAQDCYESNFLYDCRSCRSSFMCANMRGAEFAYKNKEYSQEEYEKIIAKYDLGDYNKVQEYRKEFAEFIADKPRRMVMLKSEKSTGENLLNCNNCKYCFGCSKLENCKFCIDSTGMKECYDCDFSGTGKASLCIEGAGFHDNYNCRFSDSNGESKFCDYCTSCFNSSYCFGCIGVRKAEYCILNKQYSESEYKDLLKKIEEHMKSTGEWGEFWPMQNAPFAYNETVASEYFPLKKEQALELKLPWKDKDDKEYKPQSYEVPANISEVNDDVCKQILACTECGKNYKIIPQELKFYKEQIVPVPKKCPDCRHLDRMKLRNPRILYKRQCAKCNQDMHTTYSKDKPETVYCQECYKKEVY